MMLSSLRMNKYQTHLRRIRKARFYSGGGDLRSLGRHKSTHGDFFNVKIFLSYMSYPDGVNIRIYMPYFICIPCRDVSGAFGRYDWHWNKVYSCRIQKVIILIGRRNTRSKRGAKDSDGIHKILDLMATSYWKCILIIRSWGTYWFFKIPLSTFCANSK